MAKPMIPSDSGTRKISPGVYAWALLRNDSRRSGSGFGDFRLRLCLPRIL